MSSNILRPIMIDDTDSKVQYTGQGWFQDSGSRDSIGNFGPTYQHTLHGTKTNGSFSFNFHGTSISIFGTTDVLNISGVIYPHWECFVDRISIGAIKPLALPGNGQTLCNKQGLNDGFHEVTVVIATHGQTFWFDNLQYMPSPDVSFDTATIVVDNNDPGLVYSSGWLPLYGVANITSVTGSQVALNFTGTGLIWRGLFPQEFPHSPSSATFSIDGGSPQTFPLVGLPSGTAVTQNHQVFFTTSSLPAGPHVLVVTYIGTSQQTPLTLDYIFVTNTSTSVNPAPNASSTPNQGSVSAPVSASVPPSQPVPISGQSPAPTPQPAPSISPTLIPGQSPTPTSHPSGKRGLPVGATVGGIIGGLALIALIIFLLWWRKHGKSNGKDSPLAITRRSIEVTPFTSLHPHQFSMTNGHTSKLGYQPWPSVINAGYHTSPASTFQSQSTSTSQYHVQSLIPVHGHTSLVAHDDNSQSSVPQSRKEPSSSTFSGIVLSGFNDGAAIQAGMAGERNEITAGVMRQHVIHRPPGYTLN